MNPSSTLNKWALSDRYMSTQLDIFVNFSEPRDPKVSMEAWALMSGILPCPKISDGPQPTGALCFINDKFYDLNFCEMKCWKIQNSRFDTGHQKASRVSLFVSQSAPIIDLFHLIFLNFDPF